MSGYCILDGYYFQVFQLYVFASIGSIWYKLFFHAHGHHAGLDYFTKSYALSHIYQETTFETYVFAQEDYWSGLSWPRPMRKMQEVDWVEGEVKLQ